MNKNIIIGLAVGTAVVIVGGVGLVATAKKDKPASSVNNASQTSSATSAQSSMKESSTSIAEMLKMGENHKCNFSGSDADSEFSATGYFSKNRMQYDFVSKSSAGTRNGSIITTKDTQYFWDSTSKKGFKTAVQDTSSQPTQTTQTSSQGVDKNKNYNFKCEKWSVDESKFTPPSDVQFQDLTQLMQSVNKTSAR